MNFVFENTTSEQLRNHNDTNDIKDFDACEVDSSTYDINDDSTKTLSSIDIDLMISFFH